MASNITCMDVSVRGSKISVDKCSRHGKGTTEGSKCKSDKESSRRSADVERAIGVCQSQMEGRIESKESRHGQR